MLNTSGIVPRHPILHLLDKDGESQHADIAQPLFGQALRKAYRYLKEKDSDLAEFFVNATEKASEGSATDGEIARELGVSQSTFSKKKRKIAEMIRRWKNAEYEKQSDVRAMK